MKVGTAVTNKGLVFGMDNGSPVTGNSQTSLHYKGKPTTNIYGDISTSGGIRPSRTEYNTSNWTATFPPPPEDIGRVYKHTSGALNSSWSGNSYGYTLKAINCTAGETYVMSCWVYVSPDCNLSSFPCTTESTTSNNVAVSGFSQYYDLGNKGTWQRISVKCVSDGTVTFIPVYPRKTGVTDGSFTGFYAWGGAIVELGSDPSPYTVSSRSSTQSLFNIKNNSSINVGNMTFNGNGHPTFDGTNDSIAISNPGISVNKGFTVEIVARPQNIGNSPMIITPQSAGIDHYVRFPSNGRPYLRTVVAADSTIQDFAITSTISNGNFYHLAFTYNNGSGGRAYFNGDLEYSASPNFIAQEWSGSWYIGQRGNNTYFYQGDLPVLRIYDSVLSAAEVQQNYLAYKDRFNL